ncbi:MAG: SpoIIE family protein phosphatase, partial [Verrucomicrobiota bacterium]
MRVLIVEDSELDARVLVSLLRQGGWAVVFRRVETRPAMREALESERWDLVLSDHSLPSFSAPEALQLLQETGLDLPFLIVSGGIEEGVAVAAMKAGAHDFLMKGSLGRLLPAVQRELREARIRSARRESELRYRSVWENSTDAVLLMDLDGVIRFASPAVARVFGREPEAVAGQSLDLLQPPGTAAGDWWGRARDIRQRVIESEVARPDGTPAVVEIAFTGMRMGAQEWVVAFARDITERLRVEAEIRRSRAEFAAARDIQQQLLPKGPLPVAGFELAGVSHPAAAAGGDYFDYLTLADGRLGVAVADVSGHGLASAMLMVEARAHLRLLAREGASPAGILSAANPALAEDLGRERFITLVLVSIDPANGHLAYASAGHTPVVVLAADGTTRRVLR